MAEFWNDVALVTLVISASFNILYYARHSNGKKYVRLVSGLVLTVTLFFRILLAIHYIDSAGYSMLIRPFVGIIYLLPAVDAFIDWQGKRKSV